MHIHSALVDMAAMRVHRMVLCLLLPSVATLGAISIQQQGSHHAFGQHSSRLFRRLLAPATCDLQIYNATRDPTLNCIPPCNRNRTNDTMGVVAHSCEKQGCVFVETIRGGGTPCGDSCVTPILCPVTTTMSCNRTTYELSCVAPSTPNATTPEPTTTLAPTTTTAQPNTTTRVPNTTWTPAPTPLPTPQPTTTQPPTAKPIPSTSPTTTTALSPPTPTSTISDPTPTTTTTPSNTTNAANNEATNPPKNNVSPPAFKDLTPSWLVGAIVGGGVAIVAVITFCCIRCRLQPKPGDRTTSDTDTTTNPSSTPYVEVNSTPRPTTTTDTTSSTSQNHTLDPNRQSLNQPVVETTFNWRDLELVRIESTEIELVRVLGSGASGEIWFGRYHGTTPVAVKKLHARKTTKDDVQAFIDEIALLASFDCPYIVELIGAAWTRPNTLQAVLEYMDMGDLRDFLNKSTPSPDTWSTKMGWALNAADGLVYLHSMSIIHRDLKSRNIVLDTSKPAKLADFGVSREGTEYTMTVGVGTCRWMAPEILSDSHYTNAVDMYSFGVVLTELDTHLIPFSDLVNDQGKPLSDMGVVHLVREKNVRPTFTPACPPWVQEMATLCMAKNPEDRPTASQVAHILRSQLRQSFQ
ncbi:Aste57867_17275 [Aphanomyces stellatus]|uniref:Aste57867_17275 protein n=1 Tax=Aphanomyces stellatus TaxID=120398 RepID=A0A485L8B3_9STRA|nr:hypothetical protein As57867_017216 [Aphanomyces stellatus]VFT94031.1 Aste57867_17275 [Aphanomyces stellatus]